MSSLVKRRPQRVTVLHSYMTVHDPQLASCARPSVSDSLGAKNTQQPFNLLQCIHSVVDDEILARIMWRRFCCMSPRICTVKPVNVPNKSCLEVCDARAHVGSLICPAGRPHGSRSLRLAQGLKQLSANKLYVKMKDIVQKKCNLFQNQLSCFPLSIHSLFNRFPPCSWKQPLPFRCLEVASHPLNHPLIRTCCVFSCSTMKKGTFAVKNCLCCMEVNDKRNLLPCSLYHFRQSRVFENSAAII